MLIAMFDFESCYSIYIYVHISNSAVVSFLGIIRAELFTR